MRNFEGKLTNIGEIIIQTINNDNMSVIKKYRIRYTELIDEEIERDEVMVIETKDIEYSIERLMTSKHIIKIDY